jgi:hypothetical protein
MTPTIAAKRRKPAICKGNMYLVNRPKPKFFREVENTSESPCTS